MKLYVWHDILCDYTCGVAFALASSVDEARQVIINSAVDDWRKKTITQAIEGPPDVYDTPFGSFQEGGG